MFSPHISPSTDVSTITFTTAAETQTTCPSSDLYRGCVGQENGQYSVPGYPRCFYNCWDGIAFLQQCPLNLVFNEDCACCDRKTLHFFCILFFFLHPGQFRMLNNTVMFFFFFQMMTQMFPQVALGQTSAKIWMMVSTPRQIIQLNITTVLMV